MTRFSKGPDPIDPGQRVLDEIESRSETLSRKAILENPRGARLDLKALLVPHLRWAVKAGMGEHESRHGRGSRPESRDTAVLLKDMATNVLKETQYERRNFRVNAVSEAFAASMREAFVTGWKISAGEVSIEGRAPDPEDAKLASRYESVFRRFCEAKIMREASQNVLRSVLISSGGSFSHVDISADPRSGRARHVPVGDKEFSTGFVLDLQRCGLAQLSHDISSRGLAVTIVDLTEDGIDQYEAIVLRNRESRIDAWMKTAGPAGSAGGECGMEYLVMGLIDAYRRKRGFVTDPEPRSGTRDIGGPGF